MDVRVTDVLIMKKTHPCGDGRFLVLRSGMDFKIRCLGCGREVMVARSKCEKNIKKIIHEDEEGYAAAVRPFPPAAPARGKKGK